MYIFIDFGYVYIYICIYMEYPKYTGLQTTSKNERAVLAAQLPRRALFGAAAGVRHGCGFISASGWTSTWAIVNKHACWGSCNPTIFFLWPGKNICSWHFCSAIFRFPKFSLEKWIILQQIGNVPQVMIAPREADAFGDVKMPMLGPGQLGAGSWIVFGLDFRGFSAQI